MNNKTKKPDVDEKRVLRGGSWGGNARDVRSASRVGYGSSGRGAYTGFRLAINFKEGDLKMTRKTVKVNNVEFSFIWIEPGEFMMGSPEDESGRWSDELQHKVVLTKGYWMAETACTQELWQAVMGKNLSHFKGEQLPVENVSWYDCKEFIEKLNKLVPGLDARLPTEAEWEYACRAGTKTPFSFGEIITTDQVNYDGNYPYADEKKGAYRAKTVEVKSLPPNPWGLYEMHGNVWEWCEDIYGDYLYPSGTVTDPGSQDSNRGEI
jgi:formylglycine-generating enzyme required for sulfatase activity